jgi:hypothetical protein
MNAPIENLIHISKSQSKLRIRHSKAGSRRPLTVRPDGKRASTAIGGGKPHMAAKINQSLQNYSTVSIPGSAALPDRAQTSHSQNINPNAAILASEFRKAMMQGGGSIADPSIHGRSRLPNLKGDIYLKNSNRF